MNLEQYNTNTTKLGDSDSYEVRWIPLLIKKKLQLAIKKQHQCNTQQNTDDQKEKLPKIFHEPWIF